jgi:hypothetical protein
MTTIRGRMQASGGDPAWPDDEETNECKLQLEKLTVPPARAKPDSVAHPGPYPTKITTTWSRNFRNIVLKKNYSNYFFQKLVLKRSLLVQKSCKSAAGRRSKN